MIVALWILNGLLALAFLGAGVMKIARPRSALVSSGMGWADDFSAGSVKAIGAVEAIGAIGLILPLLTGIAPILTPLASVGLLVVMVGAVVVHVRRRENPVPPIVLAALSAVSAVIGFLVVA